MTTPAQRHYQKVSAEQDAHRAGETGTDMDAANANQYELMLMQLAGHKRQLKEIQSIERKIAVKAEFLPEYEAYIDGVIASGAGVQDDVLMTLLVWRIDAGDLRGALVIGEYALAHGLHTPEQYNRDTATVLAEEVAEYAQRTDGFADIELLYQTERVTREQDMPDEVRAKLHKAIGTTLASTDIDAAIGHLQRALQLNDKAGVKKQIEQLERQKKNAS